ncbi:chemotaxis protein CheA [uncultured Ruminococcus sp.]|uniref:chemotaxis protein CheA n=1 Tax=uncultured Ruminococcus sp. TaxID=165186 RepID=UPI002665A991|nr:chemotaxis protein CheA [uncultured Ruminococcus sp.]
MPKFESGMENMADMFVFETGDLLEKLDEILMRTEQEETIGTEDINEIFRTMHTIKGSAAMMSMHNMSTLAHAVEDLFFIIREDPEVKYDKPALYELLFSASDNLKSELDSLYDDAPLTDFSELENKIHAFAATMKGQPVTDSSDTSSADTATYEGLFPDDEKEGVLTYKVTYSESCAMPDMRALVLLRALGKMCEVTKTFPEDLDADNAGDEISKKGLYIKLITDDPDGVLDLMKNAVNVDKAEQVKKPEPKPQPAPAQPVPKPAQPANAAPKKPAEKHEQSMISVKLDKLNRLLDLVAEIVITEGSVISSPDLRKADIDLDRFNKSSRELKKLTDELQDVVMSIRMVPVSTAFQKMNRVVRDMNQKLKKNVTLVFEGQETEVDKSIVDILNDPLMHIVRNAVDHGIEDPEVRAKAGKTEPATVTLSAGYDSNEVVISCRDNGAGMDTAKLMAKAKKNGMLTKPENEYTDKEIFNFVVAAGFSTNEKITEYSGRGVGMDVVKKNLEKVGGKLIVDSKFGEGSVFTIRIPLSLSILDVLSVDVGNENFSVPVSAISEAFSCKAENFITDPEDNEFIMLRDKCLPLIRMGKHFDIPNAEQDVTKGIMLCCNDGGKEAILMADRITVDQQVVVKPFSPLLDAYPLKESGLAGCSVLGDGSITMILDMKEFLGNYDFRKGE